MACQALHDIVKGVQTRLDDDVGFWLSSTLVPSTHDMLIQALQTNTVSYSRTQNMQLQLMKTTHPQAEYLVQRHPITAPPTKAFPVHHTVTLHICQQEFGTCLYPATTPHRAFESSS
ncbi:hypothetical protein NXS19_003879 [Fusarium pseudograminearum]|nr:hypothetical protein NXS19_003879 [Fusarium pseudograminearum]